MPAAAYGILNRILDHFWLTDCAPLPQGEGRLFLIGQAHKPTWFAYRDDIMTVLRDVTPELIHHREMQRKRSALLNSLRDRAASKAAVKRIEKPMRLHTSPVEVARPVIAERNRAPTPATLAAPSIRSGFVEKVR